jgi:hypothetical protein
MPCLVSESEDSIAPFTSTILSNLYLIYLPRRALGGQLNKNRWLMSQHRSVGHKMGAAFIPNFTQFPRKLFGGTFGFIYESVSYYLSLFIIIISFARHPVSII